MKEGITKQNNPELFQILRDNCDFDIDHIPKHGMGTVYVKSEDMEGNLYECYTEWDYNWGIDWSCGQEWLQVEKHENICPCCGQKIE